MTSLTEEEFSITALKQYPYPKNMDISISRKTINFEEKSLTIDNIDDSTTIANLKSMVRNAKRQLIEYKFLPLNWDGYGGVTIADVSVNSAISLLNIIDEFFTDENIVPDEITPCPLNDGSIDIELALKHKCLIFTIHPSQDEITIYSEDNRNSKEEEFDFDRIVVEEKLIRLVN